MPLLLLLCYNIVLVFVVKIRRLDVVVITAFPIPAIAVSSSATDCATGNFDFESF